MGRECQPCFCRLSRLRENVPLPAGLWRPRCRLMELLNMNRKERKRLTILSQVKQGALSLIVAAGLLGLGYRQAKRVWQR